ncbi:ABC transporter ATP-binding protein [Ilyobacter polytropus]|uniref:ABC transporter related protein n=1 Tax=Ilyobacter polytropus (strain ATCC 51220 / DSM 2926 / LMG 16218 / CuHBu1) TaxID=572544 RepID=E3HDX9_ILYPC|nr:ABC transporter ATP-binding protein [Ilyobacter polytropus]ADO84591.1 ABC transporter related protein [Ilyobacter polytropus DSM 2926]
MLKIDNLNFSYGNKKILKDFSMEVREGERVALKGSSGCGKSTLLRLIAGLEKPSIGNIFFDNNNVTNLPSYKREFGYVFQDFALFPHLNVKKNISYGISQYENSKKENLLNKYSKMLHIDSLFNHYPHELSGGQKQRVALARTLVTSPKIILLDEVFSALDEGLKESVRLEILEVLEELKITTILVTHDSRDAEVLCSKIIEM